MFDVGFMELMLIGIVALLVIGPEKLPNAVRTGTLWIGRAKRSFNQVKSEIEREINTDDIRRQLHNESIMADINKAKKKAESLVKDTKDNLDILSSDLKNKVQTEQEALKEISDSVNKQIKEPAAAKPTTKEDKPSEPAPKADEHVAKEQEETTVEPKAIEPKSNGPVEDFYNNPPKGKVMHQGREFTSVTEPEEENDQIDKQDKA
jgi:sec-independent protein translocase protein TatB